MLEGDISNHNIIKKQHFYNQSTIQSIVYIAKSTIYIIA